MPGELPHWLVHLRKDRIIYHEGDPSLILYRIKKGCVRLQVNGPGGDRQIVAFLSEGESFGYCLHHRNASAEAVTPVDLVCMSIQPILSYANGQASLIAELLDSASRHYGSLAHHLERIAHLSATERVLDFIAEEARRPGRSEAGGDLLLRMGRQDIADFLGLEPATVSRALQTLEAKGVLTRHGRRGLSLHQEASAGAARSVRRMVLTNPAA